jgi:hypothetical protein
LVIGNFGNSSVWPDERVEVLLFESGGVLSCDDSFSASFRHGCVRADEEVLFRWTILPRDVFLLLKAGEPAESGSSGRSYIALLSSPQERFLALDFAADGAIGPWLMGVNPEIVCEDLKEGS